MPFSQEETTFVKQVQQMIEDVKEIKDALVGNEFNKNGLIKRVGELERRHTNLRDEYNSLKYKLIGGSAAITIFINVILFIIKLNA